MRKYTVSDINEYVGISVNPLEHPDQIYELYSVPSFDTGYPEIIRGADIGSTKVTVEEGDILVCKINPRINRVWVVKHHTEYPLIASSEWIVIRNHEINSDYLKWYFSSPVFRDLLKSQVAGIGGSLTRAQPKQVAKYPVPLPDVKDQIHISMLFTQTDILISLRKQQLAKLDELVKARFVELFGDPAGNPKKWNTLSFREAGNRLSDGPFGSNLKSEHYTTAGVRVIRLGNIGVGQFVDNDKSYISEEHYEKLKKYTCKAGEIVIGTLGEPNLRACLVPQNIEYAVNKADCVHYIPKAEILNTKFVCQYINCPETLLLASGMVHGQTRSRISSGQLAEMPIFVPPIELQDQFAAFIEQTDKSKSAIQQSLDKLETLKKALMQKYFG